MLRPCRGMRIITFHFLQVPNESAGGPLPGFALGDSVCRAIGETHLSALSPSHPPPFPPARSVKFAIEGAAFDPAAVIIDCLLVCPHLRAGNARLADLGIMH